MMATVVIPTWNRPEMLPRAIDSVFAQDEEFKDWELLIVNDGDGNPATDKAVKPYLEDPRVSYHVQTHGGQVAAVNYAASVARGDFVVLPGDDDAICAGWLAAAAQAFAAQPDLIMVWSDYFTTYTWDADYRRVLSGQTDFELTKHVQTIPGIGGACRIDILRREPLDAVLGHNEDWDFQLRALRHGRGLYIADRACFIVHLHQAQKSVKDEGGVVRSSAIIRERIRNGYYKHERGCWCGKS